MKIVLCLDNSNGMLFGGRRQSQDRVLRARLLELVGDGKLFLNAYSAKQFESDDKLAVSEDFLKRAGKDDFCLIENTDIHAEDATMWYLFLWNRDYPGDRRFTVDLKANGFHRVHTEQFAGSSHKKITLEVYGRTE